MKDLNEGMELIGWPEAAQKDFFGKLLPAHAESLKGQALRTLDHNLLAKQLDAVLRRRCRAPSTAAAGGRPAGAARRGHRAALHGRRSAAHRPGRRERGRLGRQGRHRPRAPSPSRRDGRHSDDRPACPSAEPAEPSQRQVADRPRAARLRLPDAPEGRVAEGAAELTSAAGRSFFVFTRGSRHQETISMTARMLARHVRDRPPARLRERLPDRARHGARAQAAGRAAAAARTAPRGRPSAQAARRHSCARHAHRRQQARRDRPCRGRRCRTRCRGRGWCARTAGRA